MDGEEAHRKDTGRTDEGMRLTERKIPLHILVRLIRGLLQRSPTSRKSISRNMQRNESLLLQLRPCNLVTVIVNGAGPALAERVT